MLGGILAANVYLATVQPPKPTVLGTAIAWILTVWAVFQLFAIKLLFGGIPPTPTNQWILSSIFRSLSATAAAIIIFRGLVPYGHGWSLGPVKWACSWKGWYYISQVYLAFYYLHYRVQMEVGFRKSLLDFFGIRIPTGLGKEDVEAWNQTFFRHWLVTLAITLAIAVPLTVLLERPVNAMVNRWLESSDRALVKVNEKRSKAE